MASASEVQRTVQHADGLDRAHPAADQVVREVGRAGEVVGDASQQRSLRGHRFTGNSIPGKILITAESSSRPCPDDEACHEHLVGRRRQRQRKLRRAGGIEHEPEVLDEDVDRRQRGVVPGQHVRHAVLEHPAVACAVRDHLVQVGGVDPLAQAQRHRLRRGGDVHAGEQLVDDLHLAAVAGRLAEPIDPGRHRVERSAGLRIGRGAPRGHHRHKARRGLRRAAGDRRVEVQEALRREPPFQRDRPRRIHRRTHHEEAARLHRRRRAVGPEQHGLGLRGVDHDADDHLAPRRELGRTRAGDAAFGREAAGGLGADVADVDRVAGAPQRLRHAESHGPEADHADWFAHGSRRRVSTWPGRPTGRTPRRSRTSSPPTPAKRPSRPPRRPRGSGPLGSSSA